MANPKHLAILKQGVDAWNRWRRDDPETMADLSRVNLSDLGVLLPNDNTRLLLRPDLSNTSLRLANLSGANLWGVDFRMADLRGAILRDAELTEAHFNASNLTDAHMSGADLTRAVFESTILCHVNLRDVSGLEHVQHLGPSAIGIDTIYMSQGQIPAVFLRGAGVPDTFITYVRSLTATVLEFYSCFISHSTKDRDFADRLHADLQNKGVRCWFAPENLKIGEPFRQKIDESIRLHDKLLLTLSSHSVGSQWVQDEVEAAMERERRENRPVLFPIRIDDPVMETDKAWAASIRRTRHIGDFSDWKNHDSYQKAFQRLLRDLKAEEKGSLQRHP
jgi:TIR domain/Pentapeptide repeats (8 copies)